MKINSITIENVKSFKNQTTFEIDQGFNIIIGPNGSGKSNLMDIVAIVLRSYFLYPYKITEQNQSINSAPYYIIQSEFLNSHPKPEVKLDKFLGDEDQASQIEIKFEITKYDIENIRILYANIEGITQIITSSYNNQNQGQFLIQTVVNPLKEWIITSIKEGDNLKYEIVNNSLLLPDDQKHKIFLQYLNLYELALILSKYSTELSKLNKNILYIGPYRNLGNESLEVNLSQNTIYEDRYKHMLASSKDGDSLIKLSLNYFANKHREYEYDDIAKWNTDCEVEKISKYLKAINYDWDIVIQNLNKNIYSLELGVSKSLKYSSSGERELINFLLGIYAFNIKGGIVIIDEPELHLHPRWQKFILSVFTEMAKDTDNQFILSTHSPTFINPNSIDKTYRVSKHNGSSTIIKMRNDGNIRVKHIYQIINSTNNERIFFADAIILVEGITDVIVFRKIINGIMPADCDKIIEIIDVGGKNNFTHYKTLLTSLGITTYIIADFDYINQVGTPTVKKLLQTNAEKISKDVLKNPNSRDGCALYDKLENAIKCKDITALSSIWEYIKSTRTKCSENLSKDEQKIVDDFITNKSNDNLFILNQGEIENYLPSSCQQKDVDKVIDLINGSQYQQWSTTKKFKRLEQIIKNITESVRLL